MKKKDLLNIQWPTVEELEAELKREKRRSSRFFLRGLILVISLAVIGGLAVSYLWMPVLHINGESMAPSITDSDIVLAYACSEIQSGDIIAFYNNNKLMVKRVIATGGDVVNIDQLGNVTVNGEPLDEQYVRNRAKGECNVDMPYIVPAGSFFVMGDNRAESLDSRSTAVGCIAKEQVLGRVFATIWPLYDVQWIGRSILTEILN